MSTTTVQTGEHGSGTMPTLPLWWPEPGAASAAPAAEAVATAEAAVGTPVVETAVPEVPVVETPKAAAPEPPLAAPVFETTPAAAPEPPRAAPVFETPIPQPTASAVPPPPRAPEPVSAPRPAPAAQPDPALPPEPAPVFTMPEPEPEVPAAVPGTPHAMFNAAVLPDETARMDPVAAAPTGAVPVSRLTLDEPAEEPDFGWNFEAQDPGEFRWDNPKPTGLKKWWLPIAAGGLLLLTVVLILTYLLIKDDGKPAAQPTGPVVGPAASAMDPTRLAEFQPRHVAAAVFEGRVQVTWEAPEKTEDVIGYVVASQTRDGQLLDSQLIRTKELIAVFGGESANPGTCVVVTTMVRGTPGMQLAKGNAVCQGDPAAPPASGNPAPAGSTPANGDPAATKPDTPAAPGVPADEGTSDDQMMG